MDYIAKNTNCSLIHFLSNTVIFSYAGRAMYASWLSTGDDKVLLLKYQRDDLIGPAAIAAQS